MESGMTYPPALIATGPLKGVTSLHVPIHDLSAPDIDHQIEIEPDPFDVGRQITHILTPHLIWAVGPQPRNWSWLLGKPGSGTALGLAMGMQYSLKTALRANIAALVC
jgi:hypothetical protein